MRIIAGLRKGLVLHSFDLGFIRPTKDIVKEFIFNVLANVIDISQKRVCDLFAGTGSLGLEALSRGARSTVFVDNNSKAIELIRKNVDKAGFEETSEIVQSDVVDFLNESRAPFDLILADAPYRLHPGNFLIEKVAERGYLGSQGILVIECSPRDDITLSEDSWRCHKQKKWGESQVHILEFMG